MALINIGIDLGGRELQTAFRGVSMAIGEATFIETAAGNSFIQRNDGEVQQVAYVFEGEETVIYDSSNEEDSTSILMPNGFGVVTSIDATAAAYGAISREAHEKRYVFDEDFGRHEVGADDTSPYGGDLNDYKFPGLYYFKNLNGYINMPGNSTVSGWLSVMNDGQNTLKQIFYRQSSGYEQADTYIRTAVNGAWKGWQRLATERDVYYMPGDRLEVWCYAAGYLTSNKTTVFVALDIPKALHPSVGGIRYVGTNGRLAVVQNGRTLVDMEDIAKFSPKINIRPNTVYATFKKTSGFGGVNNDAAWVSISSMVIEFTANATIA